MTTVRADAELTQGDEQAHTQRWRFPSAFTVLFIVTVAGYALPDLVSDD